MRKLRISLFNWPHNEFFPSPLFQLPLILHVLGPASEICPWHQTIFPYYDLGENYKKIGQGQPVARLQGYAGEIGDKGRRGDDLPLFKVSVLEKFSHKFFEGVIVGAAWGTVLWGLFKKFTANFERVISLQETRWG